MRRRRQRASRGRAKTEGEAEDKAVVEDEAVVLQKDEATKQQATVVGGEASDVLS